MLVPEILGRKFSECKSGVLFVAHRAKEALIPFCEQHGFAFAFRTKSIESLAEKIETGRYSAWSELDDLWAATIVVPTLEHEGVAIEFCERAFDAVVKRRGSTRKAPEVFRFDSPRITCRLRSTPGTEPERTECFEIQVRTAFEHAWSVATHALAYKTADVDWRRSRLAAQIKAAVEQLDTLILAYDSAIKQIPESPWPELAAKTKIITLINTWSKNGVVPSESLPKDASRFAENVYRFLEASTGHRSKVDPLLDKFSAAMELYRPELFPRSISLWQWFVAELIQRELLTPREEHVIWHITEEVLTLYPRTRAIRPESRFNYENSVVDGS